MSEMLEWPLGEDALKYIALALLGLVAVVFVGVLFAFYPLLVFVVIAVIAAVGLHAAAPKLKPLYVFVVFITILIFGVLTGLGLGR